MARAAAGSRWSSYGSANPPQLHYLCERELKEENGFFLADSPCRHLQEEEPDGSGVVKGGCAIYEKQPATCRDFCGKILSGGKRYYVPVCCTMARDTGREPGNPAHGGD